MKYAVFSNRPSVVCRKPILRFRTNSFSAYEGLNYFEFAPEQSIILERHKPDVTLGFIIMSSNSKVIKNKLLSSVPHKN